MRLFLNQTEIEGDFSMKKIIFLVLAAGLFLVGCSSDSDDGSFNSARQINVVSREDGSGTRGAFVEILGIEVAGADGSVRDMTTVDAEIAPGTNAVITNISGDTYAIGYISLGSLNDTVTAINVGGIAPTAGNVQSGVYPLFRTFYIAVQDNLDDLSQDFVNFIMSAEGQAVVSRNYVPAATNASAYSVNDLSGTIVVSGSTSVAPLMERLKEAYEAINSDVTIEVHASGSTAGINAAISGLADIGMSSRELRENELADVNAIAIAFDGLAVIVNNENPTSNLTPEQIRQIFVGDITNWNGLN